MSSENEMRPSKEQNTVPQSNMVEVHWYFGVALLPQALDVCECGHGITKSENYQRILGRNVGRMGLRQRSWALKLDNDSKHASKSTGRFKWPGMSPDQNPIEHLSIDLEKKPLKSERPGAVGKKWSKIPGESCKKPTDGYRNQMISVIVSKGCAIKY